jgi:hypothetical protein
MPDLVLARADFCVWGGAYESGTFKVQTRTDSEEGP